MSISKERKGAKDPALKNPEIKTAEDFYNRLSPQDAGTIRAIVDAMRNLVSDDNHLAPSDAGFMAVYGIGGMVTKPGERPDIDILIATNCLWEGGYRSEKDFKGGFHDAIRSSGDWVAGIIREVVEDLGYKVEVKGELPDGYNEGADQKALLRLTPQDSASGKKPIDVIYARFLREYQEDFDKGHLKILEEFKNEDVDTYGRPLPRVALLEEEFQVRDFLGNLPSERGWHW